MTPKILLSHLITVPLSPNFLNTTNMEKRINERKFSIRLNTEESVCLKTLQNFLSLSSDNAVIRHIIKNYLDKENEILELRRENNNFKLTLTDVISRIKDFKTSVDRLKEIV
jgi:hypothetical protein